MVCEKKDPPPRTDTIMDGKMDETTKTGMLISSKSSRVCSNRGGLIRKYGVWDIYTWIWLPWEFGNSLADGDFFARFRWTSADSASVRRPRTSVSPRFVFHTFHEDMDFQYKGGGIQGRTVCRHLTTSYFHLYSTVKKKVPFPLSSFFLDPFVFTMSVTCSALW